MSQTATNGTNEKVLHSFVAVILRFTSHHTYFDCTLEHRVDVTWLIKHKLICTFSHYGVMQSTGVCSKYTYIH